MQGECVFTAAGQEGDVVPQIPEIAPPAEEYSIFLPFKCILSKGFSIHKR